MAHVVKAMSNIQVAFSLLTGGLNADLVRFLPSGMRRGLPIKKQTSLDPATISDLLADYCTKQNVDINEFRTENPNSMSVSEACGQLSKDPGLVPLVEQSATYRPDDTDGSMNEFNHLLRQVTTTTSNEEPRPWYAHAPTTQPYLGT